jgi:hypothetical protein
MAKKRRKKVKEVEPVSEPEPAPRVFARLKLVHEDMVAVAKAVVVALQDREWTLHRLCAESGVSTTCVYGLLHYGRSIQAANLERIVSALGMTLTRLDGKWQVER